MKWFWFLAGMYFLIAGNGLVTVFCLIALTITALDNRLTKLEQSIKAQGDKT